MANIPKKRINIVTTKLVRESSFLYPNRILSPENAAQLVRQFIDDSDREMFVAVHLNIKNEPNSITIVSIGTVNCSLVHPREVMKAAILSNATAIIVAHNHPSGDIEPSTEDIEATKRLIEASDTLGIKILDHVIVGNDKWMSFKERGLL